VPSGEGGGGREREGGREGGREKLVKEREKRFSFSPIFFQFSPIFSNFLQFSPIFFLH